MIFFQSILSLYESTTAEKKEMVVKQLAKYSDTNKQHEAFFQFLLDKMENPNAIPTTTTQAILDISIDFINLQNTQFSVTNVKQYVSFLLKLFSLKAQPTSYDNYNKFLKTSFRVINQYNQQSFFSSLTKLPSEQSIIPLSMLCIHNPYFFNRILQIIDSSFSAFKKGQNLTIWTISMTNLLQYSDNSHPDDDNSTENKSIMLLLNKVFVNKFLSLSLKINLLEAALHYLPTKLGDDLLSSHCLNLLSSVSLSTSLEEISVAVDFSKSVLTRLKKFEIRNLDTKQLVDSIFSNVMNNYRSDHLLNASLTAFFNEVDNELVQTRVAADIRAENVSLSTLFLISRFPRPDTIPFLLSPARVDHKSQYVLVFYFLSHNLVPFRYLPRLFSILEPDDLHFLNEIFEQKPVLYCTAAIKFLSQCRSIEKIEFISALFAQSKEVPVIKSPYAQSAFIVVACLRAQSKKTGCQLRLLLNYLNACMNSFAAKPANDAKGENKPEDEDEKIAKNKEEEMKPEVADDIEEEEEDKSNESEKTADDGKKDEIESAQVKISNSGSLAQNLSISANPPNSDTLDLTNEDIHFITSATSENEAKVDVSFYNIKKAIDDINHSNLCQSQEIAKMFENDKERRDSLVNESLSKLKEGNVIFTIVIGSLTNDSILIHNCVQTLAQSDLFLLTFFFTTAASCNPSLILKEIRDYIVKEPDAAPQSFVSRLFSSKSSNSVSRRQRIARRCIIGMAPFIPFSAELYQTLLESFPNEFEKDSNHSSLVCESVISVCNQLTMKEDLNLILKKLISKSDLFDPFALTQALIGILNGGKEISDKDVTSVIKLWISLMLKHPNIFQNANPKKNPEAFEAVLLSKGSKAVKSIYLAEIENAIRINGDNPQIFASLKRAIPFIPDFNLSKQPSFLTLIISNTLSENETVLSFCVNLLRSTFQMNSTMNSLKGLIIFSNEYIESVRHFFSELSGKFKSKQLLQLVEALLIYYQETRPKHQESVFLFTVFSILNQPQLFVKNKFVPKIVSACDKLSKKNDYALMFYLFKAMDALNLADKKVFFEEFISAPENEFINLYIDKYSCYYDLLEPLLIPRICQLRTIDSKWKELIEFQRLLKLFNGFVRLFVKDVTTPEKISKIIFTLLISISTVNFIRVKGFAIDSYMAILEQTFNDFKNSTGICLMNTKMALKTELNFYEFVSFFSLSFQYLQFDMVQNLLSSIETLQATHHVDCAILCLSSYLVTVSHSSTEEIKSLKAKAVDLFTSFLKSNKFEPQLISFVISRVPSAFSVTTLTQMDQNYLSLFLKLSFESAVKSADCVPSLELILNIIRSSSANFIAPFIQPIIETLRNVVSAQKIKVSAILVLNIIGELGRRKQNPTSLLKDSSVSFRSLAPLLLSDDVEITNRVKAIFSLMIFGKAESEPDFELVFTSLMSIFVGYEKDSIGYVSMAVDLLRNLDKIHQINASHLELLKFAFQPVLSVGDSACTEAISELLKFLKKFIMNTNNDELFALALGMMTMFAKPKRNISLSSK